MAFCLRADPIKGNGIPGAHRSWMYPGRDAQPVRGRSPLATSRCWGSLPVPEIQAAAPCWGPQGQPPFLQKDYRSAHLPRLTEGREGPAKSSTRKACSSTIIRRGSLMTRLARTWLAALAVLLGHQLSYCHANEPLDQPKLTAQVLPA